VKTVKAWALVHKSTENLCDCGDSPFRAYSTRKKLREDGWTSNGAFKIVRVEIREIPARKRKEGK
jgi:hypothetical protein